MSSTSLAVWSQHSAVGGTRHSSPRFESRLGPRRYPNRLRSHVSIYPSPWENKQDEGLTRRGARRSHTPYYSGRSLSSNGLFFSRPSPFAFKGSSYFRGSNCTLLFCNVERFHTLGSVSVFCVTHFAPKRKCSFTPSEACALALGCQPSGHADCRLEQRLAPLAKSCRDNSAPSPNHRCHTLCCAGVWVAALGFELMLFPTGAES